MTNDWFANQKVQNSKYKIIVRALGECRPTPRVFWCPDSDPVQSQNLSRF